MYFQAYCWNLNLCSEFQKNSSHYWNVKNATCHGPPCHTASEMDLGHCSKGFRKLINTGDHTLLSHLFVLSRKWSILALSAIWMFFSFPKSTNATSLPSSTSTYMAQCSGVKGLPTNLRKHFCSKRTSMQFSLPVRNQENLVSLQEILFHWMLLLFFFSLTIEF